MTQAEVWIIDDEVDLANNFAELIQSEVCIPKIFNSADDALLELSKNPDKFPDMIICDITLPGTDGLSFVRQCRQKKMNQPIILISGSSDQSYFEQAAALNVLAVLDKPFDSKQFRELIFRTLQKNSL